MNAFGLVIFWCAVQVTFLSFLAIVFYFGVRLFRPGAAKLLLTTSLLAIVALSLLAFSPWPRWNFLIFVGDSNIFGNSSASTTEKKSCHDGQ